MKLFAVLILAVLLYGPCSKKRPAPIPVPTPQPTPTAEPSPAAPTPSPVASPSPIATPTDTPSIPTAWATPYPTPAIDANSYIPAQKPGVVIALKQEGDEDYAAKIQAAMDNGADVAVVVLGPGSVKRSVILRVKTRFDLPKGTAFACDIVEPLEQFKSIPVQDVGCLLVADGVHVEQLRPVPPALVEFFAKGNAHQWRTDPYFQKLNALTEEQLIGDVGAILEPNYSSGWPNPAIPRVPQVAVFQALNDVLGSHMDKAQNIAITGVVIRGRQTWYDGGVRSTIQLGNCHNCTVQNALLIDTASIGISAGGVALGKDNFSNNVLFKHNITIGVAAANLALVNSENSYVMENYGRRPGRKEFAGGVSFFDGETNSEADHSKNLWIVNNLADFEGGREGAGSAFVAQDPYFGANHGKVIIANNAAIGGRDDLVHRHMSNGIYLVGLKQCEVSNNYVFRTGQNAVQAYSLDGCVIQDNDFEHTGSGGEFTIQFNGVKNSMVRRSHFRTTPGLAINAVAGFNERDGSCGNRYEDNRVDGKGFELGSSPCAVQSPKAPSPK